MKIICNLQVEDVEVLLVNNSANDIRLWDLSNSWGYQSISFLIIAEGDNKMCRVQRRIQEFTLNAPTYFVLASQQIHRITVRLNDGWWERDHLLWSRTDKMLSIWACYTVDPSDKAAQNGVFVGSTTSNLLRSEPPHRWLLGEIIEEPPSWLNDNLY